MTLTDMASYKLWPETKSSAEDRIKPFGDESEKLRTLIWQKIFQAMRIVNQEVPNIGSQASYIWLFSKTGNLERESLDIFLKGFQEQIVDDILYDYKLSTMPKGVKNLNAEFVHIGKGQPKFNIDLEIG